MNILDNLNIFVPKKDLQHFFDMTLNDTNIGYIKLFLTDLYSTSVINGKYKYENKVDDDDVNYANYFKPIIFLLYYEIISYKDLKDMTTFSFTDLTNACSKILGLYTEASDNQYSKLNKSIFIRDRIKNIYTGRNDITSYKNLDNVKEVMNEIYQSLSNDEKRWLHRMPAFIKPTYDATDSTKITNYGNFYKYFYRINDQEAVIEEILPFFSWIYNSYEIDSDNSDSPEAYFIKKYFANSDTTKRISLIYLTTVEGDDTDIYEDIASDNITNETELISTIIDFMQTNFINRKHREDDEDPEIGCIDALDSIFLKISTRTINYEYKK